MLGLATVAARRCCPPGLCAWQRGDTPLHTALKLYLRLHSILQREHADEVPRFVFDTRVDTADTDDRRMVAVQRLERRRRGYEHKPVASQRQGEGDVTSAATCVDLW